MNKGILSIDFFGNSSNYLSSEGDSEGGKSKKLNFRRSLIITALFLLNACNQSTQKDEVGSAKTNAQSDTTNVAISIPDNSFNSLDWQGTYTGTLPCEDCDGKQTTITLNKDLSYAVEMKHITKSAKLFPQEGTFEWNKEGSKITLKDIQNAPAKYLVGENALIPLDANGDRIKDYNVLKKQGSNTASISNLPITETRWIIKELMGKQIPVNADKSKPFFIQLRASDNRIVAFAGCNSIAGPYEITENNRVKFSKLMSTMMACENMEIETTFSKVLEQTKSYNIIGNKLQLIGVNKSPLATFIVE